MIKPENTVNKQDGRFVKGQSGNPNGRPKGSLNATTKAALALLDGEVEAITRKAIEMALGGDMAAIKLVMERIIPARKELPVHVNLPEISSLADILSASKEVIKEVASGHITPTEAQGILALFSTLRQAIESSEFEQRISALEVSHEK